MTNPKEKKSEELLFIKDWTILILDLIVKTYGTDPVGDCFKDLQKVILLEYEKQNLKGLRYVFKDVNDLAHEFEPSKLEQLNMLLKERFGKNLNYYSATLTRKVKQIIKKGEIKNPDEFRLLKDRAEVIFADEEFHAELREINKLLLKYEDETDSEV